MVTRLRGHDTNFFAIGRGCDLAGKFTKVELHLKLMQICFAFRNQSHICHMHRSEKG